MELLTCSMPQAGNVLVDMDGLWYLADFGAAVRVGELVRETTEIFTEGYWVDTEAVTRYDWYMLAVLTAAELHKSSWQTRLLAGGAGTSERGCVPRDKLKAALSEATHPELTKAIARILAKALDETGTRHRSLGDGPALCQSVNSSSC